MQSTCTALHSLEKHNFSWDPLHPDSGRPTCACRYLLGWSFVQLLVKMHSKNKYSLFSSLIGDCALGDNANLMYSKFKVMPFNGHLQSVLNTIVAVNGL